MWRETTTKRENLNIPIEILFAGVPDADKSELDAIAEVYCKEKTEPLLIGSVASNIGVTEAASGITGIVKVF